MELSISPVKKIDEYYFIAESILDEKAQNEEFIITDAIGQSMKPTILSGDRIVIDSTKIDELKLGDIIAFNKSGLFICHRIKEINERDGRKYYITIGDSHDSSDKFEVESYEIAGKVVKIMKRSKFSDSSSYKLFGKEILKFLGIYNLSKDIFYRIIRSRLEYRLSLPRGQDKHPAYKFVDIAFEDIKNREKEFFEPLNSIGGFRITVYFMKRIAGYVNLQRIFHEEKSQYLWAIADVYEAGIFKEIGLKNDILLKCSQVLEKINVSQPNFSGSAGIKLFNYPFISLFRTLLSYVQRSSAYRKILKIIFHNAINISVEKDKQINDKTNSVRFRALLGRIMVGSVNLVMRINETESDWWIYSLQTPQFLRGAGIGEKLMLQLISYSQSTDAKKLQLTVSKQAKAACKLYEKLGFIKSGKFDHGMIHMEKFL